MTRVRWIPLIVNICSVTGLCAIAFHFGGWIGLAGALCFWGLIETATDPDRRN